MSTEVHPEHDHDHTERVVERPAAATPSATNVNAAPAVAARPSQYETVWTVTRVVALFFTVLEVLLFARFLLKLFGANANQPLVAGLYRITEPLARPFQGIFPDPAGTPALDVAALLAIVFIFLIMALVVAIVRAITGERRFI